MTIKFTVNSQPHELDVDPDMPLLWAIRDHLQLTGTKFGCGMALCGACTVHIDGQATRSCVTPVSAVEGKKVTTIEGLSTPAGKAAQDAWVALDVPQCGYCQSGQVMSASAAAGIQSEADGRRYRFGDVWQRLPLCDVRAHPRRYPSGG
jgi:isoquinoline 1-oxidoreductase alpha subunit